MTTHHETEMLILQIQKRPILWDSSADGYKNIKKNREAWDAICCSLVEDFEDKTKADQKNTLKNFQARWKSLRDSFIKDFKKRKSDPGVVRSRPYLFSEQLSFLKKVMENTANANGSSPIQDSGEEDDEPPQSSRPKRKKITLDGLMTEFEETNQEKESDQKELLMSLISPIQTLVEDEAADVNLQTSFMPSHQETEMLIQEVQRRPIIWDNRTPDYKDKKKKRIEWEEVYRTIIEEYEDKTTAEKNVIGMAVQTRWKSIRDTYIKHRKKNSLIGKSGLKSRRFPRPYLYAKQLAFLNKDEEDPSTSVDTSSYRTQEESHLDKSKDIATSKPEPHQEPIANRKRFSLEERMVELMASGHEHRNDDKDFFMSMLPAVQSLDEDEKMEFRLQVMIALRNIKKGRKPTAN